MTRPLRVGLIIYGSLESRSGGYLYDRELVAALRRRGATVTILSQPWRSYPARLLENWRGALPGEIARLELDVLVEDELNHPSLVQLHGRIRHGFHGPIVSIVHHPRCLEDRSAWLNHLYATVERRYLDQVDAFILNSQSTAESVRNLSPWPRPSLVARPGRTFNVRHLTKCHLVARSHAAGPLRVVFLGNVIERKGLHLLMEALAQLPHSLWQLTVIGSLDAEPGYTRRVRRQLNSRGLTENVHILGRLSDAELGSCLERSHVLAMPSSHEGFGIAYLDGMSHGLPAIGSAVGGTPEAISHGEDGLLIPPGHPGALAQAIATLARDRELLTKLSLGAWERARCHPNWDASMGPACELIASLASQPLGVQA